MDYADSLAGARVCRGLGLEIKLTWVGLHLTYWVAGLGLEIKEGRSGPSFIGLIRVAWVRQRHGA